MSVILTPRQFDEWTQAHPMLRLVIRDLLTLWTVPAPFEVTCIARTLAEELAIETRTGKSTSRIHTSGPPWRALDFRITTLGANYQQEADRLSDEMHSRWTYDPTRPDKRVLFTQQHGTGPHGHLQVHANTARAA